MTRISVNRLVERVYAHCFFFFFVFEILSPQIAERTIYLEFLFVLFNPYFWNWLFSIRFSPRVLYSIAPAIILVPFHTFAAIKLIVVFMGVAFLVYCYERTLFRVIKPYILISIAIAALQFVGHYSGGAWSDALGPGSLATMVWGSYATNTNTNFYSLFFLPRASGLSREAGFFASLLITSYLALLTNKWVGGTPMGRKLSWSLIAGYIMSFSKASFALLPAVLLVALRKIVDRVPLFLIGGVFVGCLAAFWHYFQIELVLMNSVTYLARFGGYVLLYDLNVYQLIFGVSDLSQIQGPFAQVVLQAQAEHPGSASLAGLGAWCVQNGILSFFLYTVGLQALGIRGSGFLLVLLFTATVGIDTNQNFVLMSYYLAFMLARSPEKAVSRNPGLAQPALVSGR